MNTEKGQGEQSVRVMLVEDEMSLRSIARCVLDDTGGVEVVADLPTGEAAFELYPEVQPDVVLMDIHMPGEGGISATGRIVARDASARVVIWSSDTSEDMVRQAVDVGAVGFVDKLGPFEDLVHAARRAHMGDAFFSPGVLVSGTMENGGEAHSFPKLESLRRSSPTRDRFPTSRQKAA